MDEKLKEVEEALTEEQLKKQGEELLSCDVVAVVRIYMS